MRAARAIVGAGRGPRPSARLASGGGSGEAAGADGSPLRRLLDEASAFGEDEPAAGELRWATRPYAAAPRRAPEARRSPRDAAVLLFPGQGAHFVGMGRRLMHVPQARALYDRASEVLGWDVARVCAEGPAEELERRAQEATLATALAALERARDERPAAVERVRAVAGFSLGELAALVFAGALSLEQALRLAELRAAAMRAAAAERPGGMLTVWLAAAADVPELLRRARDAAAERGVAAPVCDVANYLYPQCRVLAGDEAALAWVERAGRPLGVRRAARVRVPGAFHTALMARAAAPVAEALRAWPPAAPRLPAWSCTGARAYRGAADVARGVARLAHAPVRWEQTLQALLARPRSVPPPLVLALGPGDALRATLRQVNARAWDASLLVDV